MSWILLCIHMNTSLFAGYTHAISDDISEYKTQKECESARDDFQVVANKSIYNLKYRCEETKE